MCRRLVDVRRTQYRAVKFINQTGRGARNQFDNRAINTISCQLLNNIIASLGAAHRRLSVSRMHGPRWIFVRGGSARRLNWTKSLLALSLELRDVRTSSLIAGGASAYRLAAALAANCSKLQRLQRAHKLMQRFRIDWPNRPRQLRVN